MAELARVVAVVAGAACVALLLALGGWQVQRLGWKTELIATLRARLSEPAVVLPERPDAAALAYRPVIVTGRYLHDRAQLVLARPRGRQAGYEVVTPLVRTKGPAVLVNRGFVPLDRAELAKAGPEGEVTVTGLARAPRPPGLFQPDNVPGAAAWSWTDPEAMGRALGLGLAPVVVESLPGPGTPGGIAPLVDLPNNHLGYALTWFSLAGVLAAGLTVVLGRKVRKQI